MAFSPAMPRGKVRGLSVAGEATPDPSGASSTTCPECGKQCKSPADLTGHLRSSKSCGAAESRRFVCPTCGSAFGFLNQLGKHQTAPKACARALKQKEILQRVEEAKKRALGKSAADAAEEATRSAPKLAKQMKVPGETEEGEDEAGSKGQDSRLSGQLHHSASSVESEEGGVEQSQTCPKCAKVLSSHHCLQDHLTFSRSCGDKVGRYPCPQCGRKFSKVHELGRHMESATACEAEQRRKEIQAMMGAREGPTKANKMNMSQASKVEDGPFQCIKCGKEYSNSTSFRTHVTTSKSCGDKKDRFSCKKCGATFPQASQLGKHIEAPNACDIQLRQKKFQDLVPKDTGSEILQCPKCPKSFKARLKLVVHLSTSRTCGDRASRHVCKRCSHGFPTPGQLLEHQSKGRACEINLRRTEILAKVEGGGESGPQSCKKCGKTFSTPGKLSDHFNTSRSCGDKTERYPCHGCGKGFPRAHLLAKHKESPQACETVRKQRAILGRAEKDGELLRCPGCAYLTRSVASMGNHQKGAKACKTMK